jgi:hypothetical protein
VTSGINRLNGTVNIPSSYREGNKLDNKLCRAQS